MNKLVWKWSLSYFCIVMIPILFGGILYLYAMNMVQDKSEEMHRLLAEERKDIIAQSCEDIVEYTNRIFTSDELDQVCSSKTDGEVNFYSMEMQSLLREITAESELIESVVLYLPQKNSLLSESWQFSDRESGEYFRRRTKMTSEQFYWLMSGDIYNRLQICETGEGDSVLLYTRALSGKLSYKEQKAIAIVYVDRSYLEEQLAVDGINFYLEDAEGDVYTILSEEEHISMAELQKLDLQERALEWLDNDCVYYSSLDSHKIGLYNVQHDVKFVQENRFMTGVLLVYCILCIAVGFALTYLRSRKNYQPIDGLVNLLERNGEKLDADDTWTSLQSSVKNLSEKYRDGVRQQKESSKLLDDISLRQMLLTNRSIRYTDYYKKAGEFQEAAYRVISIDTLETGAGYQEIVTSRDDLQMFHFVIDNVLSELLEEICIYQGTTIDDEFTALLCYDAIIPEKREQVIAQLEKLCGFFEESYAIKLFVNVSEEIRDMDSIADGLKEVQYLTALRNDVGSDQKILIFDMATGDAGYRKYLRQCKTKITVLRLVSEDQMEEAAAALQKLYPRDLESEKKSDLRRKKNDDLIESVIGYIHQNYADPQLNAGYLADVFQVDISKLSREFKQRKGTGVLEYIGRVRLEEAKKLLEEGNSVGDTSLAVGYYSSRPLIRLFQEYEGVTPSQYVKAQK